MCRARGQGFTLTELAVVFFIVALLMATAMFTLSAQTDQRNFEETRRRLEAARDLVLAFAVANGRLPCSGTASGDENPAPPPVGNGACASPWGGFLPARSIGFQITDTNGFFATGLNLSLTLATVLFSRNGGVSNASMRVGPMLFVPSRDALLINFANSLA